MFSKALLILSVAAALTTATPVRRRGGPCTARPPPGQPTLPTANNGGKFFPHHHQSFHPLHNPQPQANTPALSLQDHELASPPANSTLKAIGLGHGIQNYTCTPDADSGELTATALGALAVLYDITDLYPGSGSPNAAPDVAAFNALTVPVLSTLELPLNIDEAARSPDSVPAAFPPFVDPPQGVEVKGVQYPFVGRHFFDAESVPTFDLMAQKGLVARVKKDDATPAPAGAFEGPMGTGAVAWLALSDNGSSEGGVQFVYRVNTAGGNAKSCEGLSEGDQGSVSYSAMYWFFGEA